MIIEHIGVPAMLEQTAEEAIELAFACLKYARYLRGENKVHGQTETEMLDSITEEAVDTFICLEDLTVGRLISETDFDSVHMAKIKRIKKRLKCGEDSEEQEK